MTDPIVYRGLDWTCPNPDGGKLIASSAITPATYLLDYGQAERCTAFQIFAGGQAADLDDPAQPHLRLGVFRDLELAILACERHDFAFAKNRAEAEGRTIVFAGSDRIAALARNLLTPEEEGSEDALLDQLVPDQICPNGRPFRRVASYLEAKKTVMKQNSDGSYTISFSAPAREIPIAVLESPIGAKFMLGAVVLEEMASAEEKSWQERSAEAFTRSYTLPTDSSFQEWLAGRYDKWGLLAAAMQSGTSEDIAKATLETLKRLIGIPTRRDLRTLRDAVEKLEKIDREYYRDMARSHGMYVPAAA